MAPYEEEGPPPPAYSTAYSQPQYSTTQYSNPVVLQPSEPHYITGENNPDAIGRPWNPLYDPAIERDPKKRKLNKIFRTLNLLATVVFFAYLAFYLATLASGVDWKKEREKGIWSGQYLIYVLLVPYIIISVVYRVASTPDEKFFWKQFWYFPIYLCIDREHAAVYAQWNRHLW